MHAGRYDDSAYNLGAANYDDYSTDCYRTAYEYKSHPDRDHATGHRIP